jgi:uncharacterized membrane protein YqjE
MQENATMHPLLHLLMTRPELLGEHAQAYAELVGSEINDLATATRQGVLWSAAALCCAAATLVLAGMALMLALALPQTRSDAPWALLLTPCLPLLGALACVLRLRATQRAPAFAKLREQLRADLELLQEVTSP